MGAAVKRVHSDMNMQQQLDPTAETRYLVPMQVTPFTQLRDRHRHKMLSQTNRSVGALSLIQSQRLEMTHRPVTFQTAESFESDTRSGWRAMNMVLYVHRNHQAY